jgi:hypothetical protein
MQYKLIVNNTKVNRNKDKPGQHSVDEQHINLKQH